MNNRVRLESLEGISMAGERILLVDDDERLLQVIDEYLRSEGYVTLRAADGQEALHLWQEKRPDLLVLDWMMPKLSGLDVAKQIRQQSSTPIIMLTARSEESDKLVGLELGADDYLTKPFSMRELVARIRAVLRRAKPDAATAETVGYGDIVIDLAAHTVLRGGEEVLLTATEFKLLAVLGRSPNRVFSRLQLMEAAVGDYYEGYERTIDSHISHLRRKLGGDALIQTVKGTGYKLVPPRG
ncbi:MAG TPA: response regulator transcription factor [Symbiobacteriaceae bacterium]